MRAAVGSLRVPYAPLNRHQLMQEALGAAAGVVYSQGDSAVRQLLQAMASSSRAVSFKHALDSGSDVEVGVPICAVRAHACFVTATHARARDAPRRSLPTLRLTCSPLL